MDKYANKIIDMTGSDTLILKGTPAVLTPISKIIKTGLQVIPEGLPVEQALSEIVLYYNALYKITRWTEPNLVVELGVRRGVSSVAFLNAGAKKLVSFDPVDQTKENDAITVNMRKRWTFHKMTAEEGYESLSKDYPSIDLLYIDVSPHDYEQTQKFLNGYWAHNVKKNGHIVLDDASPRQQVPCGGGYGVLEAILEFIDGHEDKIDYAFSVFNIKSNGTAAIKLKQKL